MSNKFTQTLSASNEAIIRNRATILAETAQSEAESLVHTLKKDKNKLELSILQLTDLAPETSFSLRPGNAEFDGAKWVKQLHEARMDLKLKKIELEEAQSILDEWFADEDTDEDEAPKRSRKPKAGKDANAE
jgi:hypothetical protein